MASTGFQAAPGAWDFSNVPRTGETSAGRANDRASADAAAQPDASTRSQPERGARRKQQHWRPRQCRICLETVLPTFNAPTGGSGFLQPRADVTYEDESGRLLSPCKCKGSAKYVHEGCLQAWRHSSESAQRYWQCPTCQFRYRISRLKWGQWMYSSAAQVALTTLILLCFVFLLGFIADPIINLYLEPTSFLVPWLDSSVQYEDYAEDDATRSSWSLHFTKGFATMGVLGSIKVFLTSPFQFIRIGGGGRGRNTGRGRYEQISWFVIAVGVITIFTGIWKYVRQWSKRALKTAGERVMDVQGDDEGDDDDEEPAGAAGEDTL